MRAPDPCAAIVELMGGALNGANGSTNGGVGAGADLAATSVLPVAPGAVVVKVCGVVLPEDASCAIGAGANLIGVIFAKSKRQASVEQATAVVATVRSFGERKDVVQSEPRNATPEGVAGLAQRGVKLRAACKRTPLVVGVFMDQPLEEVVGQATSVGVDAIQLHGGEDPEFVAELQKRMPRTWVLKVVHLPPRSEVGATSEAELQELQGRLAKYATLCDALLLDTAVKGAPSGGTGAAFDWSIARRVQEELGIPVIVAGGLTDSNVGELVSSVGPFGVDVASGVEDAPGKKNRDKTSAYVRSAKHARTVAHGAP